MKRWPARFRTTFPGRTATSPASAELLDWVERVAMFFRDQYGLPPITGRIFGWLMVCDPPEQSGGEIAAAIGASRASITTNMRLLTAGGLARRLTRPGDRTAYYVVDDEAWEHAIRRRVDQMMSFAEITADAIEMLGAQRRALQPGPGGARHVRVVRRRAARSAPMPTTKARRR